MTGRRTLLAVATFAGNVLIAAALCAVILLFGVPRVMGWDLVVVLSGSMEPALPVGSVIVVRPVQAVDINVGDIITYRIESDEKTYVTHRVIEVTGAGSSLAFRTKGDANDNPDEGIVAASAVKGRVWLEIPLVGYLAQQLRTREGFLLLVGIPGSIIIGGELLNIGREVRRLRASKKQSTEV